MGRGRLVAFLFFIVVLAGCANNRLPWPAKIGSITGFDEDQKSQLLDVINDLNKAAGKTLITQEDLPNHFTLYYELVSPPSDNPNRAGFAIVEPSKATIQISTSVFDPTRGSKEDLLRTVAWHENGHAAGLVHVQTKGQLMYPYSTVFSEYPEAAISTFVESLLSAIDAHTSASVDYSGGSFDESP